MKCNLKWNKIHLRLQQQQGQQQQQLITISLWHTDKWLNCLQVFNKEGAYVRQIGSKGTSPGHFRSPEGIAVDIKGYIYVCDTCNDRVQVLLLPSSLFFLLFFMCADVMSWIKSNKITFPFDVSIRFWTVRVPTCVNLAWPRSRWLCPVAKFIRSANSTNRQAWRYFIS